MMVLLAATSIIAAACGSDDNASDATSAATQPAATTPAATTPTATEPAATEPAATDAPATSASATATDLDTNGDGKADFAVAGRGPADDGAYYQPVVDAAQDALPRERVRGSDRGRQHSSC